MKIMLAKRDKNAVPGSNKSPEKENGDKGTQGPVISGLFSGLIHEASFI
jgi:hypothetical protein